jgi:hypothetical protein
MIREQGNLLDVNFKNALAKCFEEIKRVAPFFSFILKSSVVKTTQRMDNLTNTTHFLPNSVVGCISNVECSVGRDI